MSVGLFSRCVAMSGFSGSPRKHNHHSHNHHHSGDVLALVDVEILGRELTELKQKLEAESNGKQKKVGVTVHVGPCVASFLTMPTLGHMVSSVVNGSPKGR